MLLGWRRLDPPRYHRARCGTFGLSVCEDRLGQPVYRVVRPGDSDRARGEAEQPGAEDVAKGVAGGRP